MNRKPVDREGLKMQLRMSARVLTAAGALALATVLSSCGFDYATDRNYTPAAGANDRDAQVDVLGATVVSAQEGSGTLVASFSNNDQEESASVDSIEVETLPDDDTDAASLDVDDFDPIDVPAGGLVSLADEGGIVVTGDFMAGDFVNLTVGFGDGESVTLEVPVMPNCNEWAGLDESGGSGGSGAESAESTDQCVTEATESEH